MTWDDISIPAVIYHLAIPLKDGAAHHWDTHWPFLTEDANAFARGCLAWAVRKAHADLAATLPIPAEGRRKLGVFDLGVFIHGISGGCGCG